jgi:xanthine dehydrogenase large subunit
MWSRALADLSTRPHDSAHLHVSGSARYCDDLPEPADLLHLAFGQSTCAHARIVAMDLAAVRATPGVVAVFTAQDFPGANDVSPVAGDDRLLADGEVIHVGQPLFLVAATSQLAARKAARLGQITYDPLPALLTVAQAQAAQSLLEPTQRMVQGDPEAALTTATHRVSGQFDMGGQDHFYLEGQIALAQPGEDGQIHVISSTQHPSEVQHLVAHMLARPSADVTIEVRRMGAHSGARKRRPRFLRRRRHWSPVKPDAPQNFAATAMTTWS